MKNNKENTKEILLKITQDIKVKMSQLLSFNKKVCLVVKRSKKDSSKPLRIELARLLTKRSLILKKI